MPKYDITKTNLGIDRLLEVTTCASPKFNPQAKLNGAPDVLTVKSRLESQLVVG
jgi:hypothetical protein